MCTCLPVTVSGCLHVYLSACHSVWLSACLPVCLSLHVYLITCLVLHVSPEYLFSVSAHCQHTCLPVYMSTCLSVCHSTMDCLLFRRKPSIAESPFCLFRIKKCDCSQLTRTYTRTYLLTDTTQPRVYIIFDTQKINLGELL
jgi:hypothetical protein